MDGFNFILLLIGFLSVIGSGYSSSGNSEQIRDTRNGGQIIQGNDEMTFRMNLQDKIALNILNLSKNITERALLSNTNKFEVLSPFSIASALQLALLGAKGTTYDEIFNLMNYDRFSPKDIHTEFGKFIDDLTTNVENQNRRKVNWRETASPRYTESSLRYQDKNPNDTEHKIEVANGIFIQKDVNLRGEYVDAVKSVYKGTIKSLDFRNSPEVASNEINSWVRESTHGKIMDIVPPVLNPNTRIVLANALYFKAEWQTTFIEGATGRKKFFPSGRNNEHHIMVDLMAHGGNFPHYYDPDTDVEILGLPYKQNSSTMYVILPKDSSSDKVRVAQKILTAEKIESMIDKMTVKTAVLLFPKMNLKSSYYLKTDLQDMGVKSLFTESVSDLSLMTNIPDNQTIVFRDMNDQSVNVLHSPVKSPQRVTRDVTYKVESENKKSPNLGMKDFLNRKRIIKSSHGKKMKKSKREAPNERNPLYTLDMLRNSATKNPNLYADEVIHKVDLSINEKGTEGGAATAITLNRSGTSVVFRVDVPFMFLIRHDPTKIPLFYGVVFEPPVSDDNNNNNRPQKNNHPHHNNQ